MQNKQVKVYIVYHADFTTTVCLPSEYKEGTYAPIMATAEEIHKMIDKWESSGFPTDNVSLGVKRLYLPKDITVQHLRAKNDINGNPRRIFVIYDSDMNRLGWIDEEYRGENFTKGRNISWLSDMNVTVKELNRNKTGVQYPNVAY